MAEVAVLTGGPHVETVIGTIGQPSDGEGGGSGVQESAHATGESFGAVFYRVSGGAAGGAAGTPAEAHTLVGDHGGLQVGGAALAEAQVVHVAVVAAVEALIAEGYVAGRAGVATEVHRVAPPLVGRVDGGQRYERGAVVGQGHHPHGQAYPPSYVGGVAAQVERHHAPSHAVFRSRHDEEVAVGQPVAAVEFDGLVGTGAVDGVAVIDYSRLIAVSLQTGPWGGQRPGAHPVETLAEPRHDAVGAGDEGVAVLVAGLDTPDAMGLDAVLVGGAGGEVVQMQRRGGIGYQGGGVAASRTVCHLDTCRAAMGVPPQPGVVRGDTVELHAAYAASLNGDVVQIGVVVVVAIGWAVVMIVEGYVTASAAIGRKGQAVSLPAGGGVGVADGYEGAGVVGVGHDAHGPVTLVVVIGLPQVEVQR